MTSNPLGTDSPMTALELSIKVAFAWWMKFGTWNINQFISWQEAQVKFGPLDIEERD